MVDCLLNFSTQFVNLVLAARVLKSRIGIATCTEQIILLWKSMYIHSVHERHRNIKTNTYQDFQIIIVSTWPGLETDHVSNTSIVFRQSTLPCHLRKVVQEVDTPQREASGGTHLKTRCRGSEHSEHTFAEHEGLAWHEET